MWPNSAGLSMSRSMARKAWRYEGTRGYTLCNLGEGTTETYDISSEDSSSGFIRYDTGLLEVNTHLYNKEKQIGEDKTLYLTHNIFIPKLCLENIADTSNGFNILLVVLIVFQLIAQPFHIGGNYIIVILFTFPDVL